MTATAPAEPVRPDRLVFCDLETTGLNPHHRFWEAAAIVRDDLNPKTDVPLHWFVSVADLDLAHADPKALDIGRFYDRHPEGRLLARHDSVTDTAHPERAVLEGFLKIAHGAHLIGSNIPYDEGMLRRRAHARGLLHSWHYRTTCIQTLIRGYLAALGDLRLHFTGRSDDLFRAIGVNPDDYDRHTALGDAAMVRDAFDQITRPGRPGEPVDVAGVGVANAGRIMVTFEEDIHTTGTRIGVNATTGYLRIFRDGDTSVGHLMTPVIAGMVVDAREFLAWPVDTSRWVPTFTGVPASVPATVASA